MPGKQKTEELFISPSEVIEFRFIHVVNGNWEFSPHWKHCSEQCFQWGRAREGSQIDRLRKPVYLTRTVQSVKKKSEFVLVTRSILSEIVASISDRMINIY